MGIRPCLGRGAGRAGSRDAPPQPLPWIPEASLLRAGRAGRGPGVLLRRMVRTEEGGGGGGRPPCSSSAANCRRRPSRLAPGPRSPQRARRPGGGERGPQSCGSGAGAAAEAAAEAGGCGRAAEGGGGGARAGGRRAPGTRGGCEAWPAGGGRGGRARAAGAARAGGGAPGGAGPPPAVSLGEVNRVTAGALRENPPCRARDVVVPGGDLLGARPAWLAFRPPLTCPVQLRSALG